jgi:hypothetical protein
MNVLEQIRSEANELAGLSNLEILERARAMLSATRFKRLRQWKTLPQNKEEERYVYHLHHYISAKLQMRKMEMKRESFLTQYMHCDSRDYYHSLNHLGMFHRSKMQEIEDMWEDPGFATVYLEQGKNSNFP